MCSPWLGIAKPLKDRGFGLCRRVGYSGTTTPFPQKPRSQLRLPVFAKGCHFRRLTWSFAQGAFRPAVSKLEIIACQEWLPRCKHGFLFLRECPCCISDRLQIALRQLCLSGNRAKSCWGVRTQEQQARVQFRVYPGGRSDMHAPKWDSKPHSSEGWIWKDLNGHWIWPVGWDLESVALDCPSNFLSLLRAQS